MKYECSLLICCNIYKGRSNKNIPICDLLFLQDLKSFLDWLFSWMETPHFFKDYVICKLCITKIKYSSNTSLLQLTIVIAVPPDCQQSRKNY